MIIVLSHDIRPEQYEEIKQYILRKGVQLHESEGIEKRILGIIGDKRDIDRNAIEALPGVEKVIPILEPYKLASRKFHPRNTVVTIQNVRIGELNPVIMAGPCAVETEEQIWNIAREVSERGGHILRGGVYKPRTSPYSFQGLGVQGAKWLQQAGKKYGLPVISEVMEIEDLDTLHPYIDIFQVGARNMQNFKLLKALGRTEKPVFMKRGNSATFNEFLMSAEYILSSGNDKVILCERGIRTFVEYTRNTFDLNIVPMIKNASHLPIIIDPSHATGRTDLIIPVTLAGLAAGADGFMVEVHPKPYEAFSDGNQSLNFIQFNQLLDDWRVIKDSVLMLRKRKLEEVEKHVSDYSAHLP
jgi:3-deoxy-7-phosphoheptulonate synthase